MEVTGGGETGLMAGSNGDNVGNVLAGRRGVGRENAAGPTANPEPDRLKRESRSLAGVCGFGASPQEIG